MFDIHRTDSCLQVEGDLDGEGAQTFLLAVESEPGPVHVDASRVARIDPAGLTALAVARSRCRAEGRTFAVTRVAPDAVRGLRIGEDVLRLFRDEPGAHAPSHDRPDPPTARDEPIPRAQPTPPPARSHGRRFTLRFSKIHRHHGT